MNTINNQKEFNYERTSLNNNTNILRTSDNKVVVPLHNRSRTIEFYHDERCYPCINKTIETISNNFYWDSLRQDVEHHVSKCDVHARLKNALALNTDSYP